VSFNDRKILNLPRNKRQWKQLDQKLERIVLDQHWMIKATNDGDLDCLLEDWCDMLYQSIASQFGVKTPINQRTYTPRPDRSLQNILAKKTALRKEARNALTADLRRQAKRQHTKLVRLHNRYLKNKSRETYAADVRSEEKKWNRNPLHSPAKDRQFGVPAIEAWNGSRHN
jgi:hypothetical protein